MNAPLIWLHEEALRMTKPVFKVAPVGTKAAYVWDDGYFRQADYSLKRLIFIYETLCELPIDIIRGDTINIIQQMAPSALYVPATINPLIVSTIRTLESIAKVKIVEDEAFGHLLGEKSGKKYGMRLNIDRINVKSHEKKLNQTCKTLIVSFN